MVLEDGYCEKCGNQYTQKFCKWCKPCQINNLKENFGNWTSKNEKIDNFIQEIQLNIDNYNEIILEWISYDQFNEVNKIKNCGYEILNSALWKDGPLNYNKCRKKYVRTNNKKVNLKYINNSHNNIDEFLDEVC
jgi:hypothetical protein